MKPRRLIYLLYRYILISFVFLILYLPNVFLCRTQNLSLETYYLLNFGGFYLSKSFDIVEVIKFLVPNLFIIYMFSEIMRSECIINYVYVFIRTAKKQKWLFQITMRLFIYIATLYIWLFLLTLVIGKFAGLPLESDSFFKMILPLYFLNVLTIFEFVFLQNILSMKNGSALAFILIVILYAIPLIAVSLLQQIFSLNIILYFILPTNQMYLWHTDRINISEAESFFSSPLSGFFLLNSLLILFGFIVVSYHIYRYRFIRKDMIELIKE